MKDTPSSMGDSSSREDSGASSISAGSGTSISNDTTHTQYLREVAAESIGWQPIGAQTYLHLGAPEGLQVIDIVGVADASMTNLNVVLLNY